MNVKIGLTINNVLEEPHHTKNVQQFLSFTNKFGFRNVNNPYYNSKHLLSKV
jgi:hypothetical protein